MTYLDLLIQAGVELPKKKTSFGEPQRKLSSYDKGFNEYRNLLHTQLSKEVDLEKLGLVRKDSLDDKEIELLGHQYALDILLRALGLPKDANYGDISSHVKKNYIPKASLKELLKKERLDAWKTAHAQYKFDDVMNKELFIPKSSLQPLVEVLETIDYLSRTNCDWDKGTQLKIIQAIKTVEGMK